MRREGDRGRGGSGREGGWTDMRREGDRGRGGGSGREGGWKDMRREGDGGRGEWNDLDALTGTPRGRPATWGGGGRRPTAQA